MIFLDEIKIVSQKADLSKKLKLLWAILLVLLAAIIAYTVVKYVGYKKGQEAAVEITMSATNQFNYYTDEKELVNAMYDLYNPHKSYIVDNSDQLRAAWRAADDLSDALEARGYDDPFGDCFLKYYGYPDYVMHGLWEARFYNNYTYPVLFAWAGLFVVLSLWTIWYSDDRKKSMTIDGNKIICKKGEKVSKEFLVKDVKSVQLASIKGLKVDGNGIKYRINLVKNADELKSTIMGIIETLPAESDSVNRNSQEAQSSSADELLKYKELLDGGVISQEEFDAKKKQLLGL